jgi:hypothetical protein
MRRQPDSGVASWCVELAARGKAVAKELPCFSSRNGFGKQRMAARSRARHLLGLESIERCGDDVDGHLARESEPDALAG